jgi:hypothetical protein
MTILSRALLVAFLIVAVPTVAILFVVAIQAGPAVLVLLVVCVGLLSWIAQRFASSLFGLIQSYATAKYQHAEQMANKGVLVVGRGFPQYNVKQAQIAAPAPQAAQLSPPDPRREHALRLLSATVESDKYGPKSVKVMTQKDAGAVGIIADDWSAAVNYLFLFGVATGNTGTIIKDSRNVARLLADVARDAKDNEVSAVMALPENKR